MRLIDADALIERIDTEIRNAIEREDIYDYMEDDRCSLIAWLQTQPTAYDVDKVVEELGEATWQYNPPFNDEPYRMVILSNKAVQIVKRGGVDER